MQDADDSIDVDCFAIKSRTMICFANGIIDYNYLKQGNRWLIVFINKKFNFNIII